MGQMRRATLAGLCTIGMIGVIADRAVATGGQTPTPAATALTTLPSEVVHGLASDTDLGAVDPTTPMTVGIGTAVDGAVRTAAYQGLITPGSPTYHHWYTPASFQAAFGVPAGVVAQVRSYATRHGLQISYASPDGSYLLLSGTTAEVESTFSVAEHRFQAADGSTFTANTAAPTVPATVAGVSGLTSLGVAHTHLTAPTTTPAQDVCRAPNTAPLPAGVPTGNYCLGALTPSDVRSIYKVPTADQGNGQKIAIFGEGELANVVKDLRAFESTYAQPVVPVREVLVGDNLQDSSGDDEWKLDSQASTGMAPALQELDFYFGSALSDQSITATYEAWVNDPAGPLTGNSSFGGSEQTSYLGSFLSDVALQQAAMEGRTMFVSAGDVGGSCLPGANGVTNTGVPCVEYPASSPYVTSVGGTVIYSAADPTTGKEALPPQRALEYAWNYSGGGHSNFEPAPALQIAAFQGIPGGSVPCVANPGTGKTCRGVPDVSALSGDLINGYAYVSGGKVSEQGGTSLSSPLWAGVWANVQAASNTGAGFAQSALYTLAESSATADADSFFDVGGTTNSVPAYGNGQNPTLPRSTNDPTGYDFVTGLGSPIVGGLATHLDGTTAPVSTTVYPADPATPTIINYGFTSPYANPAFTGCTSSGTATDPAGDATTPAPAGNPYDLTSLALTSDPSNVTFSGTVVDSSADAGSDVNYAWQFTYLNQTYAVTVDTGPNPTAELYLQNYQATPIGLLVETAPTALGSLTPQVTEKPGGTISVTMPLSTFNADASPLTPLTAGGQFSQVSLFTNNGPATSALPNDFNVDPIDQVNLLQCNYTVAGLAGGALHGYWLDASDGGIFSFGPAAHFAGSTGAMHLNQPVVGMAADPATGGYWLVASDGGIFAFNAPFFGSTGGIHLNKPIVGIAAARDGQGYWLVASDGGVFAFGPSARFAGSTGDVHLTKPIVGMAADPATTGYWLVASDGGIFAFNAPFDGSTGAIHLNKPIVGMAAVPGGGGYWLAASDGGIFTFGPDAHFYGSTGGIRLNKPVVGMAPTTDGKGYWLAASDGGIFTFGPSATFYGSAGAIKLTKPVVGIATAG